MKFATTVDVDAPIEFVFDQITDFKGLERAAMRRGAEVRRVDGLSAQGPGMAWDARFELQGRTREVQLELTEHDPPKGLVFASRSPSLGGRMAIDLAALSHTRTRVAMDVELHPNNLSARLLVQSLKLARKGLKSRVDERLATYSGDIEARYRRSVGGRSSPSFETLHQDARKG